MEARTKGFPFSFLKKMRIHATIEKKEAYSLMYVVAVICIIIVIVVLILAVGTTSKAYTYKHTVDPLENNPHLEQEHEQEHNQDQNKA
jgi:Ca2+/H+ antiporter